MPTRGGITRRTRSPRFCNGIVDAVAPYAVAVKPQLAFFEALGADGMRALESVRLRATGRPARHRRRQARRHRLHGPARPPTSRARRLSPTRLVNLYLGRDSLEPLLGACRRHGAGVFCLVKTSNEGGEIQDLKLSDGLPLWQHVAKLVAEWGGPGRRAGAFERRRRRGRDTSAPSARHAASLPQSILLLPGVGAQGASPGDVARAFTRPASALVAASRSVIYAFRSAAETDWRSAAAAEAARLKSEIWVAAGW